MIDLDYILFKCSFNKVAKLNSSAIEAKNVVAHCAITAEKVDSPTVGKSMLVFYEYTEEGGGWEVVQGDGGNVAEEKEGNCSLH